MIYKGLNLAILFFFILSCFAFAESEISYDYLMKLGYESAADGDLNGAIEYFTRAHQVYPPGKEAVSQIAILNEKLKEIQDTLDPTAGQNYTPYDRNSHLYQPIAEPKVKKERDLDAKYKSAAQLMIDIEQDKKEKKEMLSRLEAYNEMLSKDNASLRQEIEKVESSIKENEQMRLSAEEKAVAKKDKEAADIQDSISKAKEQNSALKGQNEYLKALLDFKKAQLDSLE